MPILDFSNVFFFDPIPSPCAISMQYYWDSNGISSVKIALRYPSLRYINALNVLKLTSQLAESNIGAPCEQICHV